MSLAWLGYALSLVPCNFVAALAREARRSERPSPFRWWTAQHPQPVWDMLLRWYCVYVFTRARHEGRHLHASGTEILYVYMYHTVAHSYNVRCTRTAIRSCWQAKREFTCTHMLICTGWGQCQLLLDYSQLIPLLLCAFKFLQLCVVCVWFDVKTPQNTRGWTLGVNTHR